MAIELGALAAVVDKDLNDIVDLPDYKNPPAGAYKLLIEEVKAGKGDKTNLQITYVVDMVKELADPETAVEDQVIPGNKFTERFYFDKTEHFENTLGALKKKMAPLSEPLGTTNLLELLDAAQGLSIDCVITNRFDKTSMPWKRYATVTQVSLATS